MPIHGNTCEVFAEQIRRPLIGFAAHEAVEILKAHPDGPLIEGPCDAVLKARGIMVLAEPRSGIAVVLEDRADRGALRADDGIIAGVSGGQFADDAETHGVVVAPGDQRRTRREHSAVE